MSTAAAVESKPVRRSSPPVAAAPARAESWRDDDTRAVVLPGADDLESDAEEAEAEDLDLEDLSDDEEPELPADAPVPEEDDSEW
jgi:hypothetical protein